MGKININLSNMKLQDIIKQLLVVVLISLYGCSDFLDPKIDDTTTMKLFGVTEHSPWEH